MVESPLKEYRKVKTMEREMSMSTTMSTTGSASVSDDNQSIRSGTWSHSGSRAGTGFSGTESVVSKAPSANKAAANAVGRGFGKVGMALTKGAIDLPRAMADGLHNVPALYGDKVRDYGEIRGWKSGTLTGVKVCFRFCHCFPPLLSFSCA